MIPSQQLTRPHDVTQTSWNGELHHIIQYGSRHYPSFRAPFVPFRVQCFECSSLFMRHPNLTQPMPVPVPVRCRAKVDDHSTSHPTWPLAPIAICGQTRLNTVVVKGAQASPFTPHYLRPQVRLLHQLPQAAASASAAVDEDPNITPNPCFTLSFHTVEEKSVLTQCFARSP